MSLLQDQLEQNEARARELKDMILAGAISLDQVVRLTKDDVIDLLRQKYSGLKGQRIGAADAARKYGLRRASLTEWVNQGVLTPIGGTRSGGGNSQMILDESEVAVLAELRTLRKGRSGPIMPRHKAS